MKFSVMEMQQKASSEPFIFDEKVDVSELASSYNNDIKEIDPVRVKGMATIDGNEFIFSFSIEGQMILPCARTLVDVPYELKVHATEIFTTSDFITKEDEEDEVHVIDGEMIDLTPYILEHIVLATPFRVFSDQEALDTGDGWSFRLEDEHQEEEANKIDPRLAKLGKLLKNKDQNESE